MSKPIPSCHVLPGEPPLPVALCRSARARRVSLRLGADGRATLTLPARAALGPALAFLRAREGWLRDHLARRPPPIRPAPGLSIPFEGGLLRLEAAPGPVPRRAGDVLLVPPDPDRLAPRLETWLREQARARLLAACDRHAATLGRRWRRLVLRDPRSRWGSCSAAGDLMFSWRLVLAPPAVLDYVAAHEVAHLERMDHSPAFWAVVARLCPGHAAPRRWLRQQGASLHRLRLDPDVPGA